MVGYKVRDLGPVLLSWSFLMIRNSISSRSKYIFSIRSTCAAVVYKDDPLACHVFMATQRKKSTRHTPTLYDIYSAGLPTDQMRIQDEDNKLVYVYHVDDV